MLQKVSTELKPALAFLRRGFGVAQISAIQAFAAGAGFEIVAELSAALEGAAVPAITFANLADLIVRIDLNSARAVIVSSASLFSDTLVERVVGYERLRERGVELIAADAPDAFSSEADANAAIRQILASSALFDAATTTASTRVTASSRRTTTGRAHRKTYADLAPEATLMAKRLYQAGRTNGERITLREISARLADSGFLDANQKPFHPEVIRRMLKGNWPRHKKSQ
ncbi:MAG: recombinase family protein [Hyphomicrobium sp.]|jgi:hypothetical protein